MTQRAVLRARGAEQGNRSPLPDPTNDPNLLPREVGPQRKSTAQRVTLRTRDLAREVASLRIPAGRRQALPQESVRHVAARRPPAGDLPGRRAGVRPQAGRMEIFPGLIAMIAERMDAVHTESRIRKAINLRPIGREPGESVGERRSPIQPLRKVIRSDSTSTLRTAVSPQDARPMS